MELGRLHDGAREDLAASGELVVSEALTDLSLARRVRVTGGETMTSDGPFAEVKEHLAGSTWCSARASNGPSRSRPGSRRRRPGGGEAGDGYTSLAGHVSAPGRSEIEELLRELAPHVLAVLIRLYCGFEICEDAVQEALLAAATQRPADGLPGNPMGRLVTVASRRSDELSRSDEARHRREESVALLAPADPPPDPPPGSADDDTVTLLLLCCHPSLSSNALRNCRYSTSNRAGPTTSTPSDAGTRLPRLDE